MKRTSLILRTYNLGDEARMVRLWNRYIAALHGCYPITEQDITFEVLSKVYFDPGGLIFAEEGRKVIGFVHAGFFAPDRITPDYSQGTICMLVVEEGQRAAGLKLVGAVVDYLRGRGAKTIRAFDIDHPRTPFYNGMYGGEKAGLDEDHPQARKIFEAAHFTIETAAKIMTIVLKGPIPDFPCRNCEIVVSAYPSVPEGRSFHDSYGLHDAITRIEARVDGELAGSMITWRVERMEELTGKKLAAASYVHVEEKFRGTNVGQAMFRHLYDRLISERVETLGLGVNSQNARAIRFYEKIGMTILKNAYTYKLGEP